MAEEKSGEIDLSKLSLPELLEHKNWKARIKGYEDINNQMQQAVSDKDPIFSKYSGGIKNWVSDTNAVALEKAIEAVYTFVECAAVAAKTAAEVCPVLVQKCLAHTKQKIRDKTQEILMMYIEIEKADVVGDALIEGFSNKNPKVVAQCIVTYTCAVSAFGVKTVNVKNVMKQIGVMLEHRDNNVREQTKALVVELHRWIGVALKPQLQNVKPVTLAELEGEFEKEKGAATKPTPTRYLRSQKPQATGGNQVGAGEPDSGDVQNSQTAHAAEPDVDSWNFLAAADVLSKLPKNFYEQIESTKWAERKECLDLLLKLLADNPKLDPACNYGELVAVLKKIISKDNNINVVGIAAKCTAALASGLRKKFAQYASMFVPIILEKFKEKKPVVALACVEAIDAVLKTTSLESISEEIVAALDNKTPSVKVQTTLFLNRAFVSSHPSILTKKLLKLFCTALVKNIGLSDPEVRDSSAAALGSAMKLVGDKNIMPFLTEIKDDHLKMDKIKEYCEKTVLENAGAPASAASSAAEQASRETVSVKKAEPASTATSSKSSNASTRNKPASSTRPASSAAAPSASAVNQEANKNSSDVNDENEEGETKRPSTGRAASSTRKPGENSRPKKETETGAGGSSLIDTNQKLQRFQEEKALKILKWNFTTPIEEHVEQLKSQLATTCKPALHAQLFHSNFKQFLKALEDLTQCLESSPEASINCSDLLLKWCTLRFFETNPSVLLKCLEYIQLLLQLFIDRSLELHDLEVVSFAPYLLLKAGEPKDAVRQEVRKLIQKMTKLYPATKLFPLILDGCKTKNSRQKAECLEQLGLLIDLLGVSVCGQPPQPALKAIAQNIGDKDNAVRNAALNAIVSAYNHMGEKVLKAVGTINEKEFTMLQERIKRSSKMKKPPVAAAINSAAVVVDKKVLPPPPSATPATAPSTSSSRHLASTSENDLRSLQQIECEPESSAGLFKLEINKIFDPQQRAAVNMPELTLQGDDLAQILRKPFEVPSIVKMHQASPAKRPAAQNVDAVTMLDTTISQVTSSHIYTAIQALVQLDEILKDASKAHFLSGKIDQLLMAIYFQLRMVYNKHMNDNAVNQNDVLCLYRHLCLVLLSLCSAGNLIKDASDGALKDLVCQLLTVLVDDRLNHTNEGAELIRSINILIVNLVTKSDHTACFVALLRLLRDTLHSQTSSNKFQELVMRCIWKLSRQLPNFADQLDLQKVLLEAHQFFVDFPSASWKTRPCNTPSRTVKTILNTLCNILGDKILDFVGLIPEPETSEVVQYLRKCLDDICSRQPLQARQNGHGSVINDQVSANSMAGGTQVDHGQFKEQVSRILKKVGTKEHTKEGLVELYEFLQAHPDFDMECYYRKCSEMFKSYIQKNLKRLASERKKATNVDDQDTMSVTSEYAVSSIETLQKLRMKCGLVPSSITTPSKRSNDSEMSLRVQAYREEEDRDKPEVSASQVELMVGDDIDNLKKRLEKIKRGDF